MSMEMTSGAFIQTLPATDALDIVGDVHGEWQALQQLLHHLGYDEYGAHPHGRKLVFVGDLCDRGPDSPAVLNWVIQAIAAERAFAILGNHELNLLMNDAKEGSGWYFPQRTQDEQRYGPWQTYANQHKAHLQATLSQWPLILQRADLRIVHAAWLPASIQQLVLMGPQSWPQLYQHCEDCFKTAFAASEWFDIYQAERLPHRQHLYDEDYAMPFLSGLAHYDLMRSHANPVRALACGVEALAKMPFYINGRWRFTVRSPWWRHYHEKIPVVIGHYWRQWNQQQVAPHRQGLFHEPPAHWLGEAQQVFCIDFSVGARWKERLNQIPLVQTQLHLAALRWPEKHIMLDNGVSVPSIRHHSFQPLI